MSEKLEPCPFCGGGADLVVLLIPASGVANEEPSRRYFVKCLQCRAETSASRDKGRAIAAWNRRAARAEARPAPIDSAPRDGSWIVGWRANFRPFPTRWHPYSAPGGLGSGWWGGEPTHWLPFPTEQTFEDAEK